MARYVVVEFAENADAEEFIKRTNELNADSRKEGLSFQRRIVAVFVKPGRTCGCSGWEKGNSGAKNWPFGVSLGAKFGWWVCDNCGKPRRGGHQLYNQLDMGDTYEGAQHDHYEFGVTSLDITGIRVGAIDRPKKLRRKKAK